MLHGGSGSKTIVIVCTCCNCVYMVGVMVFVTKLTFVCVSLLVQLNVGWWCSYCMCGYVISLLLISTFSSCRCVFTL